MTYAPTDRTAQEAAADQAFAAIRPVIVDRRSANAKRAEIRRMMSERPRTKAA